MLKGRRPQIQQDLARAMADKDFRENAPLDAARNEQGHLEARIREIDADAARAVVLDNGAEQPGDVARIGDLVTIKDLRTGGDKGYTLVNPTRCAPVRARSPSPRPSAKPSTSIASAKK